MAKQKRGRQVEDRQRRSWVWLRHVLLWTWLVVTTVAVLAFSVRGEYDLTVGDVAPQNIRAPRDITFISEILSAQAQGEAARRVAPVYTAPDSNIAREQYRRARDVLVYLRALRDDPYTSLEEKRTWVLAVPELSSLPPGVVDALLTLPDSSWSRVQLEFLDLLDKVMRQEEIRQADLASLRRRIPSMVSLELAQDEASAVEALVSAFVRPNVFYDEAATEDARRAARENVGPVVRTLRAGEVIVREGEVVSDLDLEALEQFGLTATAQDEENQVSALIFGVLLVGTLLLFVRRMASSVLAEGPQEALFILILTLFEGMAWALLRSGELVPYLFPAGAVSLLLVTTLGQIPAVGGAVFVGAIGGWVASRSLGMAAILTLGGVVAMFTLPRYEQTGTLLRSGLLGGLLQGLVIVVFAIDELALEPVGLILKVGTAVLSGLLSGGLTIAMLFVLTPLFDLTTTFRLTELSRPNHPLLQRLLREAPATFHHVMMVASLAEQAAERIGANALLTRVGAYYHDIGKLSRPYFFAENQQGLSNPHERLDPYTSVDILAGHVHEGLRLAQKYRLPGRVKAFIPEHHGTMRVSFLYRKAVEAAGGEPGLVDEGQFRYPGPKPQSKETLLVMLADGCEAAARARRPETPEELATLVDEIFTARMQDGQMDECPITLKELRVVRDTYIELLRAAYHPRLRYPQRKTVPQPAADQLGPKMGEKAPAMPGDDESTTERVSPLESAVDVQET